MPGHGVREAEEHGGGGGPRLVAGGQAVDRVHVVGGCRGGGRDGRRGGGGDSGGRGSYGGGRGDRLRRCGDRRGARADGAPSDGVAAADIRVASEATGPDASDSANAARISPGSDAAGPDAASTARIGPRWDADSRDCGKVRDVTAGSDAARLGVPPAAARPGAVSPEGRDSTDSATGRGRTQTSSPTARTASVGAARTGPRGRGGAPRPGSPVGSPRPPGAGGASPRARRSRSARPRPPVRSPPGPLRMAAGAVPAQADKVPGPQPVGVAGEVRVVDVGGGRFLGRPSRPSRLGRV